MEKPEVKKVQLPFIMKPKWSSYLAALLAFGLFICIDAYIVYWAIREPINFHNWHELGMAIFLVLFIIIPVPIFILSLGKIVCTEECLKITILGLPVSKIKWNSIHKVSLNENADVKNPQPRLMIYHDKSLMGLPTWINNFMFKKDDLAIFISLLRQNTAHVKFKGFRNDK
jgi:hypothetical protein